MAISRLPAQSGSSTPRGAISPTSPTAGSTPLHWPSSLAAGLNRYTGVAGAAPGMSAIEHGVDRLDDVWLFVLGHSLGVHALWRVDGQLHRDRRRPHLQTGRRPTRGVLYVSPHTHHSVAKAARLAGFRDDQIRTVVVDADLRMDPRALAVMHGEDRDAGQQPFLVVGIGGHDRHRDRRSLRPLAEICADARALVAHRWRLRGLLPAHRPGSRRLAGIERADSIAIDPHKGLSIPFGNGALLVRDEAHLIDANQGRGAYLLAERPPFRVRVTSPPWDRTEPPVSPLQVWLPLHLHGVAPFREALDLDTSILPRRPMNVSRHRGIETLWGPDLSIVAFGFDDDDSGRAAMEAVNQDRLVHLSSTVVDGPFVLRFAILNRRTTLDHIDHAIDIIEKTLTG